MDIIENKQEFLTICHSEIHRDGLENLLDWLTKADFFTAPASAHFHGAYAGGLCEHSLDVYHYAKRVAKLYDGTLNPESMAIAALFHDVCKVNLYKEDTRNQKIDGNWVKVPCYTIEEKFSFGGHGSKSVYQVQWYMKLTPEEAVAINCHMGFSDGSYTTLRDVSNAYQACPLAWIIHVADEAATFLLDRSGKKAP